MIEEYLPIIVGVINSNGRFTLADVFRLTNPISVADKAVIKAILSGFEKADVISKSGFWYLSKGM